MRRLLSVGVRDFVIFFSFMIIDQAKSLLQILAVFVPSQCTHKNYEYKGRKDRQCRIFVRHGHRSLSFSKLIPIKRHSRERQQIKIKNGSERLPSPFSAKSRGKKTVTNTAASLKNSPSISNTSLVFGFATKYPLFRIGYSGEGCTP